MTCEAAHVGGFGIREDGTRVDLSTKGDSSHVDLNTMSDRGSLSTDRQHLCRSQSKGDGTRGEYEDA